MKGFQITFFTEQNRRHGHKQMSDWLLELAKSLNIRGATVRGDSEGIGRDGRFHSAHFFELADQPVEVTFAVTEEQATALFSRLEEEKAKLFYVKAPVEYGTVGGSDSSP